MTSPNARRPARKTDPARVAAFRALRDVTADGAYANLALAARRRDANLSGRDAAFATQLVSGVARSLGTLDAIIVAASGRALSSLQPAVIDALRLGAYQGLCMRVPASAAVGTTVDLAASLIGERVSGVVNAVMRKVVANAWGAWVDQLTSGMDAMDALALRTCHPRWIVDAFADVLPAEELAAALDADNQPPAPTLAVRPGLCGRDELAVATGAAPTAYSPWGVTIAGDPGDVEAVADGKAGVQDEGSQLVVLASARAAGVCAAEGNAGAWLDMCAGPGGKTALLRGLCGGRFLVAADAQPHRAGLVADALRAFDPAGHAVIVADGTRPAWGDGRFGLVLADVPCSGLGALRRRPESRWRRHPSDLEGLRALQTRLLDTALASAEPAGTVAYVTCSPHRAETADIVLQAAGRRGVEILDAPGCLPEVPGCAAATDPRFVQLWPHRHGTDAMFLALLRRRQ